MDTSSATELGLLMTVSLQKWGSIKMRRLVFLINICVVFITAGPVFADAYVFDKAHSQVMFSVSHQGFTKSNGAFRSFDGKIEFDQENLENSSVEVTTDTASLDMNTDSWASDVKGERWLNVENQPTITFNSNSVKKMGENTMDVMGNLSFFGETKPVTLNVTINKVAPVRDTMKAGFSATAQIDRREFGMERAVPAIGALIDIQLEIEAVKM